MAAAQTDRLASGGSNSNNSPRLRSACDSCRQSKVKCSGESTCSRCLKQDLPCHYSPANRAGKPKGSKNKTTIRRLEHLERLQRAFHSNRGGSFEEDVGFWQTSKPPVAIACAKEYPTPNTADAYRQVHSLFPEGFIGKDKIETVQSYCLRDSWPDLEWMTYYQPNMQSQAIMSSPIAPSTDDSTAHLDVDGFPLLDATSSSSHLSLGATDLLQTLSSSPIHYPSTEESVDSESPPMNQTALPPTTCTCFENQTSCLNQLYRLDCDTTMWRFDLGIQSINSSLSSYRKALECPRCRKERTNHFVSMATLELLFRAFERLVSCEIPQHNCHQDDSSNIRCGYYSVPGEEGSVMRNFLIQRMLCNCKQTLASLKQVVHACFRNQHLHIPGATPGSFCSRRDDERGDAAVVTQNRYDNTINFTANNSGRRDTNPFTASQVDLPQMLAEFEAILESWMRSISQRTFPDAMP